MMHIFEDKREERNKRVMDDEKLTYGNMDE